ncbi:MAG: hypothetical protein P1U65_02385 [Minwuia sp.]|nr:hypothetical protein [Minwuia sp.]
MMDRRTRLLTAPVLPTLFRLAVPSIAAMMIMSSMSIVEAWYLGREGTIELAGVALVFPIMMLSTMLSAGAIGGGIVLFRSGDTDPDNIFILVAAAMVIYGLVVALGLRLFAWRPL